MTNFRERLLLLLPLIVTARNYNNHHRYHHQAPFAPFVHSKVDPFAPRSSIAKLVSSSSTTASRGGSLRPAVPFPPAASNDDESTAATASDDVRTAKASAATAAATAATVNSSSNNNVTASTTTTMDDADAASLHAKQIISIGDDGITEKKGLFRRTKPPKNYKRYAKKLKNRNATNLRRKIMHCSFGLFFAALNHFIPKRYFVIGMTILSTGTLAMELLRYREGFRWMNDALHVVLGSSLRKHEMEGKFTGSFYFFTGVTVSAALFDRNAATLGIAQLALADPSASYFGRATRHVYWSRIENGLGGLGRNKGILGFVGGALFCFPFNYRVLSLAKYGKTGLTMLPGGRRAVVLASLALGLAGALADLAVPTPAVVLPKKVLGVRVPPLHLDDNFVVPVVSAWACEKVFTKLHWDMESVKLATFLLLNGPGKPWIGFSKLSSL